MVGGGVFAKKTEGFTPHLPPLPHKVQLHRSLRTSVRTYRRPPDRPAWVTWILKGGVWVGSGRPEAPVTHTTLELISTNPHNSTNVCSS